MYAPIGLAGTINFEMGEKIQAFSADHRFPSHLRTPDKKVLTASIYGEYLHRYGVNEIMKKFRSAFAAALLFCVLLAGCSSGKNRVRTDPANFLTDLAKFAVEDLEGARRAYEGKTGQMTVSADYILSGSIGFQIDNSASATIESADAVKDVAFGKVFTLEGVVDSIEKSGELLDIHIRPTKILNDSYRVSGEIKVFFGDWEGSAEKAFYVVDDSVLPNRQIMIYVPRESKWKIGDRFTAEGELNRYYNGEQEQIDGSMGESFVATLHMAQPAFPEEEESK